METSFAQVMEEQDFRYRIEIRAEPQPMFMRPFPAISTPSAVFATRKSRRTFSWRKYKSSWRQDSVGLIVCVIVFVSVYVCNCVRCVCVFVVCLWMSMFVGWSR